MLALRYIKHCPISDILPLFCRTKRSVERGFIMSKERLQELMSKSYADIIAMSDDEFKAYVDEIADLVGWTFPDSKEAHTIFGLQQLRNDLADGSITEDEAKQGITAMNRHKHRSKTKTSEKVKKYRYFNVQRSYKYDTNTSQGGTFRTEKVWRDEMHEMVKNIYDSELVDYIAYIFHDRDVDEQGLATALHCHFFVKFKESQEQPLVRSLFGATSDKNCQNSKNNLGSVEYLTHISTSAREKEKTVYSFDEVHCINCRYKDLVKPSFWGKQENKDNDLMVVTTRKTAEAIADKLGKDIRDGKIRKAKALELFEERAGYSWVRKLGHTFDFDQEEFIKNRVVEMTAEGRNNTNIYIMGSGGIGKSHLGRKLGVRFAEDKGLYATAPLGMNKTPDALNSYVDEKVAIFNEMSARGWTLDEFLECFDPYSYASFPSRNSNKDFIGDTSIFTNSISPIRFAKDLLIYSKGGSQYQDPADKQEIDFDNVEAVDKYWQVRRRFNHMIVLLRDENDAELVHGYVFNLKDGTYETGNHVLVGNITFENKVKQAPNITDDTLDKLQELMTIDVDNMTQNVKTIDVFLEENGIVEASRDSVIDSFVDEVINKCVWDLLPATFIYDLYREYRNRNFPKSDLLNRDELMRKLEMVLTDWERKKYSVQVWSKMDADEPLITEYNLERWTVREYAGSNMQQKRQFKRQKSYQGFVRK